MLSIKNTLKYSFKKALKNINIHFDVEQVRKGNEDI